MTPSDIRSIGVMFFDHSLNHLSTLEVTHVREHHARPPLPRGSRWSGLPLLRPGSWLRAHHQEARPQASREAAHPARDPPRARRLRDQLLRSLGLRTAEPSASVNDRSDCSSTRWSCCGQAATVPRRPEWCRSARSSVIPRPAAHDRAHQLPASECCRDGFICTSRLQSPERPCRTGQISGIVFRFISHNGKGPTMNAGILSTDILDVTVYAGPARISMKTALRERRERRHQGQPQRLTRR